MQQNSEVSWNIEMDGDGTNTWISLDKKWHVNSWESIEAIEDLIH